jgi:hypothetical protein
LGLQACEVVFAAVELELALDNGQITTHEIGL